MLLNYESELLWKRGVQFFFWGGGVRGGGKGLQQVLWAGWRTALVSYTERCNCYRVIFIVHVELTNLAADSGLDTPNLEVSNRGIIKNSLECEVNCEY
jgi:hypothetical protein